MADRAGICRTSGPRSVTRAGCAQAMVLGGWRQWALKMLTLHLHSQHRKAWGAIFCTSCVSSPTSCLCPGGRRASCCSHIPESCFASMLSSTQPYSPALSLDALGSVDESGRLRAARAFAFPHLCNADGHCLAWMLTFASGNGPSSFPLNS